MMSRLSTKQKVLLGFGIYVAITVLIVIVTGWSRSDNTFGFEPQNEFKLDNWVELGEFSINKAVMYVVIAGLLTVGTMLYVANRMQARPNRVQTLVEVLFGLMRDNITRGSMDDAMARKWFPFIGTLFLFILFSNLIGYIPLPTNTEHPFSLFGIDFPSFALYAATANLSIPLVLALVVFIAYTTEGIRAKGPIGYLKSLIPAGVTGGMAVFIFILELFSNIMRLMSLSVRLFANILAGHLIILFMGGALAVLLGIAALGWITFPLGVLLFVFEVGLVAGLQAFIFATLTAIYLGGAVAESHYGATVDLAIITTLAQAADSGTADAGKAIALGVGGGLGAAGAGVGIGIIFGKVIESVTRQPEMRDEITSIQWLGFALTEACVFYGLVAGLLAFFL